MRADNPIDNVHTKMMEANVLDHLLDLLKHRASDIQSASLIVITALVKIGRLIDHFVLCRN